MSIENENTDDSNNSDIGRRFARAILSATVIASFWGVWAAYANFDHGKQDWLAAASTQAALSFFATFYMTFSVETLFNIVQHKLAKIALSIVGTMVVVIFLIGITHVMMGTPEVIKTIAPPSLVGFCYCTFFTLSLARKERMAILDVPVAYQANENKLRTVK